jgi:hypothetical protein
LKFRLNEFIEAVIAEGSVGETKLQLLMKLGFKKENGTWVPPTFSEFYRKYVSLLDQMQIPENERIRPAMAIATWGGRSYQGHILFDPHQDPWPDVKKQFSFVSNSIGDFNLPGDVVIAAMSRGRYPLLPAMHDVFHYLTFIEYPEYAKALRAAASKLEVSGNPKVRDKFNFLNEVLALPDLEKKNAILSSLISTQGVPRGTVLAFAHFQKFFESLEETQLLTYAEKLAFTFPTFLKDFGGAIYNSHEIQGLHMMAKHRSLQYATSYFARTNTEQDLAYASPITFGASLHGLIQHLQKPPKPYPDPLEATLERTKATIRQRLASMEYFLWYFTTENITPEVFAAHFVRPDGTTDPVLQMTLQNIWGLQSTYSEAIFE